MFSGLFSAFIPPSRPPKSVQPPEKNPLPTRQFGTTLIEIKKQYKTPIPPVLETCIKYLSTQQSLGTPDIFKTSISLERISRLADAADHKKELVFETPHEAAVLIKVFLRELKEPLFPPEAYKRIVEFHKVEKYAQMHAVHLLVRLCPNGNIRVIRALVHLLNAVAENAEANGMNAEELSKMFGQGMFIRNFNGIVPVADIIHVNYFIEFMISNCNGIFT